MYTCSFCIMEGGESAALTFSNDATWLDHLCSEAHAANQRKRGAKKTFVHWDDKRTLVVSGVFGLKQKTLVNYFSGLGDLQNFYYVQKVDGASNYCKVLMVEEKSAKKIHKTGHHAIGGVIFQTRLQNQPATKLPPASVMPSSSNNTNNSSGSTSTAAKITSSSSTISSASSGATSIPSSIGSSTVSSTSTLKVSDKFRRLHGTAEGGFVPGVGYRCQICEQVVGSGEEKWVQHLISKEHQDIHRGNQHLRKVLWDLDKKLEVSKVKGMNAVYILRYVAAFGGPVLDFSYIAKKDGGTNVCYVLFATRDGAEKLTKAKETHCIGPQRRNVKIRLMKDEQKLKWRKWRDKLLRNVGEEPTAYGSASEEENEDEDEDEDKDKQSPVKKKNDDFVVVTTTTTGTSKEVVVGEVVKPVSNLLKEDATKKRKSCELSSSNTITQQPQGVLLNKSFPGFAGLSLTEQFEKFRTEFGWSSTFLKSAVKFVDQTIGSLHLKQKKIPFGDLTTGLGLQSSPTLQLLVDVQDILESKPDSANTQILTMLKNSSQALEGLKAKKSTVHPILKIWTTESEVCLNTKIENQATCLKLRFSNTLPFHECSLFKFCTDLDCRILPMSFMICHWATFNNFLQYSKQSYPNQLIILMIMSYLQLKKVLPTVQKLIEISPPNSPQKIINGNIVSFCSDLPTVKKLHPNPLESLLQDDTIRAMSILGLLRDWFEFFGDADLKENAICSRFGILVPKKDFQPDSVGNLPGDLCRVYRFGMSTKESSSSSSQEIESVTMKKFLCSQTSLCIQNPFDLSLNCSRGVTPNEVLKFQHGCKEASSVLSSLLTCDQPDLSQFLSMTIPPVETKGTTVNSSKKVKIEEVVIDTTPQKPAPVTRITTPSEKVVVSSTSSSSSAVAISKNNASSSSNNKIVQNSVAITSPSNKASGGGGDDKTSRPGAADFFDSVIYNPTSDGDEAEDNDDDNDDDDDDEDESMEGDNESVVSDGTNKECTILLNISLFKYFARTFAGTEDMKFKKCQLLILQYILDFNSKFWTNCLGLAFLPKVGQKFWSEDFAKIVSEGKVKTNQTLIQKVMAISDSENEINLSFRVKSDGGIIHKMFLEKDTNSLRTKVWAAGKYLTDSSLLLYEEVPESRLQEIKSSSFVGYDQLSQPEISFDCCLLGGVMNRVGNATPIATLAINVLGGFSVGGMNCARIDVIKALYRKLGMTYINKMVKRWLAESKDFDEKKAANFVRDRNQKWNRKANRKRKKKAKLQQQQQDPKIPVHNPRAKDSQGPQPSASFRPQHQHQQEQQQHIPKSNFRPPPPRPRPLMSQQHPPPQIPFGRGQGYSNASPPRHLQQQQYHNPLPSPNYSSSGGGNGIGMGRGRGPFIQDHHPGDRDNYQHGYQQQQQPPYYNRQPAYYEQQQQQPPPPQVPSEGRILRNPGPQGMRTFYPPHQQAPSSQPHLLPNPQFSTPSTTIQNSNYNGYIEGIDDNAELSFQSLPHQQQQGHQHHQPNQSHFHHGYNPKSQVGIKTDERTFQSYRPPPPLVPNPQFYQNSSTYPPPPVFPTPAPRIHSEDSNNRFSYQQQQQQPQQQHHQMNPEYPQYHNNDQPQQHHRYQPPQHHGYQQPEPPEQQHHRFEGPPANNNNQNDLIVELPPLMYNPHFQDKQYPNPNFDRKPNNNLNPNIRHFNNSPQTADLYQQGRQQQPSFPRREQSQFPMEELNPSPPHHHSSSSFENNYSRPDRPPNTTFPNPRSATSNNYNYSNNNMQRPIIKQDQMRRTDAEPLPMTATPRPTRYFNNNDGQNTNNSNPAIQFPYETRVSLPNREASYGSRPSQPRKRGFVSGGYLSTERAKNGPSSDSDDDLQIIYDNDPKGNSSPPPPPLKKFRLGAAFPVPSKPSSSSGRRSVSPISYRNPLAEQRRGYIPDPGRNIQTSNPYHGSNNQGYPNDDNSSQYYGGGRRF